MPEWRIRAAAGSPTRHHPGGKITGGTGRKDRTMAQARRPRKWSVEQIAQLLIGAANALARLLDAIHHMH
jgi:hypothetical protein